MRFLKTHLISLLSGVMALAFIVVAFLGMSSSAAQTEMERRKSAASRIDSLKRAPKNEASIKAEQRRSDRFQEEYDRTLEAAKSINRRKPLTEGVFPIASAESLPYKFKEDYEKAMKRLPVILLAGELPNAIEIDEESQNVEDAIDLEREKEAEGGEAKPAIRAESARYPRSVRPSEFGRRGRPMARGRDERRFVVGIVGDGAFEPLGPPGGDSFGRGGFGGVRFGGGGGRDFNSSGEPRFNAVFRANVSKAKSIRCYAGWLDSFDISPIVQLNTAPTPTEMWFAQVGLWVQRDIADAIAALNEEFAARVKDADAYVEHMPVKRIEFVRVWGYQLPGRLWAFPTVAQRGGNEKAPDGPSFTGRVCDEQFDVVRFSLVVVVDQREVVKLIDRISRANFYQCTNTEYATTESATGEGYMYGTAPVVRAKLEFEGYMARDVYKALMPKDVRETLGVDKGDEG